MKTGTRVRCDEGFTCGLSGQDRTVLEDKVGQYLECGEGRHYLNGDYTGLVLSGKLGG
jgi:hypothetical protein